MFDEDGVPKAPIRKAIPADLEPLSVEELRAFRAELEQEIFRVDAEMARKQQHKSAAEGIFKP